MRHKGQPKVPGSGRKAGVPNKRTTFEQMCVERGVDFFQLLIDEATNPDSPNKFNAIKEGCQYILPKKKETDHKFSSDTQQLAEELSTMTTEELKAWIKANAGI